MNTDEKRPFSLLFVDDEPAIVSALVRAFRKAPYDIHTAENGLTALEILGQTPIDAALVDLKMPQMGGMTLLAKMREQWPQVRVVILTGHGGVQEAVEAVQLGAVDFMQKPFEPENLNARVNQLYHIWVLEQENRRLKEKVQFQFGYEQMIGNASIMLNMKKMILQVAASDASILVQGETGTGKELVARAIHYHSRRKSRPFVPVDCAGISETVMGSELFGHARGAYTGAHEATPGLIRSADRGTLFLDEVGELSLSMQVKLLRAIQEKEVRPVGESRNIPVDVRFLAATNRNLEEEVAQGRFRQDLFYRLNVVVLNVPPLRERLDDLPLLSRHFIQQFKSPASVVAHISPDAMVCLNRHNWPGNVRELENVMRRAVAMGQNEAILPQDLPEQFSHHSVSRAENGDEIDADSLVAYELAAIQNALFKCNGHRRNAANMLGIGEATLYRKLNKYKL